MIPVWEHFEDLEEILYVADVETYELVYLNRYGRSVFRIEDEDNYAGKRGFAGKERAMSVLYKFTAEGR